MLDLKDPINKALFKQDTFIEALFKRPESLSKYFAYDEFTENHIFRQKDGSLGVVFEVKLLEHEPMTVNAILSSVDSLKSWFNLPTNCTLQVLYDQAEMSPLDKGFDEMTNRFPNAEGISKTLYCEKIKILKSACGSENGPLVRRTFVSLRYYPDTSDRLNLFKRGEAILYSQMKDFIAESRNFLHLVNDFKHNSKIELTLLGANELLDVLRRYFNPKTYYKRPFAPYNSSVSLSDQILYNSPTLDFPTIEREGMKTRTLTLKTNPRRAYPGGMAYFTKLLFPYKLSLNFKFPTRRQSKSFFDLKEFFLQNTPSARAQRQKEEVQEVQRKLANDDRCLHMTFSVVVEGESDEVLERRVREVLNIFHNDLECEVVIEDDIGLGLFLNTLPLNYIPKSDYSAQRYIRILKSDVTKFIPIFDSFRGLKNPVQVFLSRENNLVPFSLTENETSNHTVVVADTGSGKSKFIIDCILSAKKKSPEPLVFVIDKKSSCVMAAKYCDADLTIFDRREDFPFTPFRGVYDEEKFANLTQLLVAGIKLTSPTFEIDSIHQSLISRALKSAYAKKCEKVNVTYTDGKLSQNKGSQNVELAMDDFIAELGRMPSEKEFENTEIQVNQLTQRLMPFYSEGDMYSKYFKGKAQKERRNKSVYIYDLDALDSDPTLQTLMTMAVMEEIRQTIMLPENRGRGGFIVFEEIGRLGRDNPVASRYIVDFAETMRKLGYWLISLTPRPQHYFELEAGKAMWQVADNFIFLQMSTDNVDYIAKNSSLLDEASIEIIKSLRTKRGEFADVFYMNKKKDRQGAFRYAPKALEHWLAPTNSVEMETANRALKKFKDKKWEALEYLATTYPNGVKTEEAPNVS